MTDFRISFDKMAEIMAQKATHPDTPFAEVTDAFKAMTTYLGLMLKYKEHSAGNGAGDFDFDTGIGEEDGSRVPSRRGS